MLNTQRDSAARAVLTETIRKWFDAASLDEIEFSFGVDHLGENTIFVSVWLKAGKDRLAPAKSVDLQLALRDALEQVGDDRFPYLAFSAPDDDFAQPGARISA